MLLKAFWSSMVLVRCDFSMLSHRRPITIVLCVWVMIAWSCYIFHFTILLHILQMYWGTLSKICAVQPVQNSCSCLLKAKAFLGGPMASCEETNAFPRRLVGRLKSPKKISRHGARMKPGFNCVKMVAWELREYTHLSWRRFTIVLLYLPNHIWVYI